MEFEGQAGTAWTDDLYTCPSELAEVYVGVTWTRRCVFQAAVYTTGDLNILVGQGSTSNGWLVPGVAVGIRSLPVTTPDYRQESWRCSSACIIYGYLRVCMHPGI